jgi:Ca2+-binding RTX toxin-like protein
MIPTTLIEPLDSRRLLSTGAAFTASAPGVTVFATGTTATVWEAVGSTITRTGTLVVKGTAEADRLSVIRDGNKFKVTHSQPGANIVTVVIDAARVKRVWVEALGGDDRVFIDNELANPCTVFGGSGDDVIDGNNGATLLGGAGDDKLSVSRDGDRPAYLSGGDGNDTLVANAATDTVAGGRGNVVATGAFALVVTNQPPTTTATDVFGGRASGIEQFFSVVRISHG